MCAIPQGGTMRIESGMGIAAPDGWSTLKRAWRNPEVQREGSRTLRLRGGGVERAAPSTQCSAPRRERATRTSSLGAAARFGVTSTAVRSRPAIIALLTALNLVNYIDRFLVMAVGPKIQESLHLSDAQLGWVTSAFIIGYLITSPLFGWLGDRYPRKGLIAAGVLLWSAATALSGLADGFATLIAARLAVGVGEASYATLSPTIIDDLVEAQSKNRYLAIFYVATPVGAALGYLIGGELQLHYGWRAAFFIAGGPGVLLSLVTLAIHEPARAAAERVSLLDVYAQLAKNRLYVSCTAGYIAQTFALGGFTAWAAPFLYRKLCLELHTADRYFGAVTVVTGLAGTALGGWLADRWPGEDRTRAALQVCALSSAIATPLAALALFSPTSGGFLMALGACELAVFASVAPTNMATLASVPPFARANAMAVSIAMIHLLGDLISPPMIGTISDRFGDTPRLCSGATGLQTGMLMLPVALALSTVLWWHGGAQLRSPR
jgi:MFS transporter, Spinster family, sphingosine-1-phosphate transporter